MYQNFFDFQRIADIAAEAAKKTAPGKHGNFVFCRTAVPIVRTGLPETRMCLYGSEWFLIADLSAANLAKEEYELLRRDATERAQRFRGAIDAGLSPEIATVLAEIQTITIHPAQLSEMDKLMATDTEKHEN